MNQSRTHHSLKHGQTKVRSIWAKRHTQPPEILSADNASRGTETQGFHFGRVIVSVVLLESTCRSRRLSCEDRPTSSCQASLPLGNQRNMTATRKERNTNTNSDSSTKKKQTCPVKILAPTPRHLPQTQSRKCKRTCEAPLRRERPAQSKAAVRDDGRRRETQLDWQRTKPFVFERRLRPRAHH